MKALLVALAVLLGPALSGGAASTMNTAHAGPVPAVVNMMGGSLVGAFTNRTAYVSPWDGRRIPREAMARVW